MSLPKQLSINRNFESKESMMNYRKRQRTLCVAFVAALGLMAFMGAGAQAQWLYLLVNETAHTIPNGQQISITNHTPHSIVLVPGLNLELLCTTLAANGISLESDKAKGKIRLTNCTTYTISPLTEQKSCKPHEPIEVGAVAELKLHTDKVTGTKNYLLFSPPSVGGAFTILEFPETCALVETSEITGTLLKECGHLNASGQFVLLDCLNHQVSQLLREAVLSLPLGHGISFGENKASIDGIELVSLAAPLAGLSWGGHHIP